ncbi:cytochrome P450 [Acidisphaera sp. S103]|uniref:cytochrome P450 n=1 Tax=Acidisphaera sp. S103 TaxID=1747223 RepID=UPI001C20BB12|nr:cytochrome P450 [Acidisphaera sp. S103]
MPLTPPVPAAPEAPLALRAFLRAIRTNALTIWPQAAYHQDATVRHFLGRTNVLLNTPDAIHHVLVANPGNYRRSPASIRILRPITGQGLLLSEGDDWKLQRRTVAPALAPRVMPMLARHIVSATNETLARLTAQSGQPLDLLATMQTLALDIAGRSMFSLEMDRYGPAMRRMLTEFGEKYAQPRLLDMLLPPSIPTPSDIGRARFRRRWMGLMETILSTRLATPEPETPRDLFDLLRAARDPETGAGFSPGQLRDQVATLILAGHETTAVTLFWALIMLAEAPEEQDWLAEEAINATIEPETAYATTATLIRTRAVVNETLRLFPAAFLIVREAIGADRIGDLVLPPRALVMIAPWVLHRHHALWHDPALFRPARFMPDQPAPPRFAFMPFGAGPRICVGAQFAMTEATLVLAALIGRFRMTRVDARQVLPIGIVTTQPDHPAHVRLTPRL